MNDDYEISLSRTPDGHVVATNDASVPLENEFMINEPGAYDSPVFIHLDVIHDGSLFSVWICDSQDRLNDPDLETKIKVDKRDEIIEAIKKLLERQKAE